MRRRFCVFTTNPVDGEPRAPFHAIAVARAFPDSEVIFVDCVPCGTVSGSPSAFNLPNLTRRTCWYGHRKAVSPAWLAMKAATWANRFAFRVTRNAGFAARTVRAVKLEAMIRKIDADVYFGHNDDALLALYRAAGRKRVLRIFDSMELHSDMGQPLESRRMISAVERKCLPFCDLVLTPSAAVARKLVDIYNIPLPLTRYNAAPIRRTLPPKLPGFHLYWRNGVVALGERGLGDVLCAMKRIPEDVQLHIRGHLRDSDRPALAEKIAQLELGSRVFIEPRHAPHEAVEMAAPYTVGLCPERGADENNRLTSSNKIFDYMMAGLAVISSAVPGQIEVLNASGGGLMFKPRDVDDLARCIRRFYEDPALLRAHAERGRQFALTVGNLETQAGAVVERIRGLLERLER